MSSSPAARWCAVTGGRGFLGRRLVAMLLGSGEWRVRVVDLAPAVVLGADEEEREGSLGAALRDGRAIYVHGDVRDVAQMTKAFDGVDAVFHTASVDPIVGNFKLHYSVNVEGTKNVIDACITCKVSRLIHTSSSGVVFDGVHGLFDVNESMPYPDKFVDAYTETKAPGEKLVLGANGTKGLLTCSIRPGNIFGPGGKNIPMLVSNARIGMFTFILGRGKNYDDFVQLKIRLPVTFATSMAYLICWVDKIFLRYLISLPPVLHPASIKYATVNRTFSCLKAHDHLGYKPIVSVKDGLKITLDSFTNFSAQK